MVLVQYNYSPSGKADAMLLTLALLLEISQFTLAAGTTFHPAGMDQGVDYCMFVSACMYLHVCA